MAYLQNDPNDPNNQQGQNNNQPAPAGGTSLTSGGPALSAGGASQAAPAAGGNQFSNLQKLMNLNQNAPNTASKVGQNVQQGQATQQNNVGQATQGIGSSFNYDQNDMNNKVQNNDFGGLKQQLDTTYNGPKAGTVNVGPQNLNQINQQTQALGSQAGQQQLLKQQYGRSDYTGGQQKLDNFLQSRNQDFQVQAAQARNQGKQLQQSTQNQNAALNQKAASTENQTVQGVQNLKQGLGNTANTYQTDAQKAADAANAADQVTRQKSDAAKASLANGESDAETLQGLGFNPDDYTYGTDLSQFVNYQGNAANANNIMAKDNANRFNNINQLLGTDGQVDLNTAGTYQQGQEAFDKEGLQKALGENKTKYEQSLAPAKNQVDYYNAINALVNQRNSSNPNSTAWQDAQNQLNNMGASTNGYTRADWAQDELNKRNQAYNQVKQQLDSQYMKKVGVKS